MIKHIRRPRNINLKVVSRHVKVALTFINYGNMIQQVPKYFDSNMSAFTMTAS